VDARLQRDVKDKSNKLPYRMKLTASECPAERVAEATTSSVRSEDKSRRTCYLCHQVGHMRKQCPFLSTRIQRVNRESGNVSRNPIC